MQWRKTWPECFCRKFLKNSPKDCLKFRVPKFSVSIRKWNELRWDLLKWKNWVKKEIQFEINPLTWLLTIIIIKSREKVGIFIVSKIWKISLKWKDEMNWDETHWNEPSKERNSVWNKSINFASAADGSRNVTSLMSWLYLERYDSAQSYHGQIYNPRQKSLNTCMIFTVAYILPPPLTPF